jgi:hypothetical protein
VPAIEQSNLLMSRSTAESGRLAQQLQSWANTNGAVLAPSIQQVSVALAYQESLVSRSIDAWAPFKASIQQTGAQISAEVPKWYGLFQSFAEGLPNIIVGAFQGGGDVIKAAGSWAGTQLGTFLSSRFGESLKSLLGPALGGALNALLPGIGALAGPLISALGGLFKKIFGGASEEEKKGRAAVREFEDGLWDTLTAAQELEAGGEDWKKTVIALRDAYIAAGKSEEDALRAAEELWSSSREGAEASARVIEEIKEAMRKSGDTAVDAVTQIGRAVDGLPDIVGIRVKIIPEGEVDFRPPGEFVGGDPGFAAGTKGRLGSWFGRFPASGMATKLHNVEAVLRPQDAMPFAQDVMQAAGATTNTQSNNVALLIMQPGEALDPSRLTREVFKQFKGALSMDTEGMETAIESVVENYMRTYQHG